MHGYVGTVSYIDDSFKYNRIHNVFRMNEWQLCLGRNQKAKINCMTGEYKQ